MKCGRKQIQNSWNLRFCRYNFGRQHCMQIPIAQKQWIHDIALLYTFIWVSFYPFSPSSLWVPFWETHTNHQVNLTFCQIWLKLSKRLNSCWEMTRHTVCAQYNKESRLPSRLSGQRENNATAKKSKWQGLLTKHSVPTCHEHGIYLQSRFTSKLVLKLGGLFPKWPPKSFVKKQVSMSPPNIVVLLS